MCSEVSLLLCLLTYPDPPSLCFVWWRLSIFFPLLLWCTVYYIAGSDWDFFCFSFLPFMPFSRSWAYTVSDSLIDDSYPPAEKALQTQHSKPFANNNPLFMQTRGIRIITIQWRLCNWAKQGIHAFCLLPPCVHVQPKLMLYYCTSWDPQSVGSDCSISQRCFLHSVDGMHEGAKTRSASFLLGSLLPVTCLQLKVALQCLLLAIGFGAIIVADSRPLGRQFPDEAGCLAMCF